jgi:hypothetical protein
MLIPNKIFYMILFAAIFTVLGNIAFDGFSLNLMQLIRDFTLIFLCSFATSALMKYLEKGKR